MSFTAAAAGRRLVANGGVEPGLSLPVWVDEAEVCRWSVSQRKRSDAEPGAQCKPGVFPGVGQAEQVNRNSINAHQSAILRLQGRKCLRLV